MQIRARRSSLAALERQHGRSERHRRCSQRQAFARHRNIFYRQCPCFHFICFESCDSCAIRRAYNWPSHLSQYKGIVGHQQARSVDNQRGRRNASNRRKHHLSRLPGSSSGTNRKAQVLALHRQERRQRQRFAAKGGTQPIPDFRRCHDRRRHILCRIRSA